MKQAIDGEWVIHLAEASGFSSTPTPTGLTAGNNSDFQVIDVDGDGLSDLVYAGGQLRVRYLRRVGSTYEFTNNLFVIDLPSNPGEIDGISTPTLFSFMEYIYNQGDDINIRAHDVNGDGVADLILKTNVYRTEFPDPLEPTEYRFVSAGDNQTQGEPMEVLDSSSWVAFVFNGINTTNGRLDYRSENYYLNYAVDIDDNVNLFLDFDGDGAVDHLRIDDNGIQKLYPRNEAYQSADQITTFTNGMGASTQVLYRPLTFSSAYTQGNHQTTALNYGLGSPVLDMMGAFYVVRQVDMDAPIEGDTDGTPTQNTTRYRYEDARVQTGGRGFLGFEKVITATPVKSAGDTDAKILESVTTYRQDFPYNGIAANTEVTQLDENFYATNNVPPVCTG